MSRNLAFVAILDKLDLIKVLVEYFSVGHERLNAQTVRIVKHIVESKEIDLPDLVRMKVFEKLHAILKHMTSKNEDWSLDHLMDMIYDLLHQAQQRRQ